MTPHFRDRASRHPRLIPTTPRPRASAPRTPYGVENAQARQLYQSLNRTRFAKMLAECDVRFSARLTTSGGVCYPSRASIRLSIHLLREHGWPEMAEVLLHEMVHLWVHAHTPTRRRRRLAPHGAEFLAALRAVSGRRRYCLPFESGRRPRVHIYHCPQGHEFVRRRRLAPHLVCAACAKARLPAALTWVEKRS